MSYGQVTTTGTAVAVGSVIAGQFWLAAVGIGSMILVAGLIRYGWRRGRRVDEL
jgi:hypothetical protein